MSDSGTDDPKTWHKMGSIPTDTIDSIEQEIAADPTIKRKTVYPNTHFPEPDLDSQVVCDIREPIVNIDLTRPDYTDAVPPSDKVSDDTTTTMMTAVSAGITAISTDIEAYPTQPADDSLPNAGTNLVPTYFSKGTPTNGQS